MSEPLDPIIIRQLAALLDGENCTIANLSNACALLKNNVADLNWCGFYFYNKTKNELILGPFQGNVACMHIKNGNGVCGTAYSNKSIIRVANVHEFPGHIACDSASNSEIVLPLFAKEEIIGVLDIDSPRLNRFTKNDESVLEQFTQELARHIDNSILNALNY